MSIMVWGHRGFQHHRTPEKYPEAPYQNSPKALDFALSETMGLETDVIQSSDHTVYLTHDTVFIDVVKYELAAHLDEASKKILGDRFIFDLADDEASKLRLKDGQKLQTLSGLLEQMPNYPGRILNLELKGPNTLGSALTTVDEAIQKGFVSPDQILFSSFDLYALRDLREQRGDQFKIGALMSMKTQTKSKLFPDWPNTPQESCYTPFNPPEEVLASDVIKAMQPDYFHIERNSVTLDDIALINKYYPKAKINLWCIGEPHPDDDPQYLDVIDNLATSGKIYAVMSDFPKAIQDKLVARGLDIQLPPQAGNPAVKSKFSPK